METDEVVKNLEALRARYEAQIEELAAEMDLMHLRYEREAEGLRSKVNDLLRQIVELGGSPRGQIPLDLERGATKKNLDTPEIRV